MNPINTFRSSYKFVELHRTFYELRTESSENDDVDISRAFHLGEHLRWPDLIKEYRLIIASTGRDGRFLPAWIIIS